ncbi:hypothetical protein ACPPVO_33910 [Dactylosporangium sp. McL0621]|uniref:hypothetical protein n=1 Tax=Dactylosporangium sp. McL0621 TaxID=3415678 RepID=UPI003CFA4E9E
MTEPTRIDDLPAALATRAFPTIGRWNRLEGRPRTTDFDRALRAELRDPLWMLTRQWQLGEFRGSDAGSPVTALYSIGTADVSAPAKQPIEAAAERRTVPMERGPDPVAYDLRLTIGRRWLKLLGSSVLLRLFRDKYVDEYPIAAPDPAADADTPRTAHPEVWAQLQAVSGRRMDGFAFYRHLVNGGHAYDGIPGSTLFRTQLDALGTRLVTWFNGLIDQPTGPSTWDPRRLEHHFSVDAGGTTLTAPEYPGGSLDWHTFSVDTGAPAATAATPATVNRTVLPAPVRFSGMPLPRWWAIEDGTTNFAAVQPDSTDLIRLVFLEFALVFSNSWYLLPCDLPAGTLANIQGLAVTDVFGQRQWITPAGTGVENDWQRWSMYTLDTPQATDAADTRLLLPAHAPQIATGPALEDVSLIRDEQANLVWGVERTISTPTGDPRRGDEIAAELLAQQRRLHPAAPPDEPHAAIAYTAMNDVPAHWIPFIAAHVPDDSRSVQLQRAALPSPIDGTPVRPHTALLREGLPQAYFVNEEEVPPTGTTLALAFRRTRSADGSVTVWLGTRRGTGRGEGSSGLAYDIITPTG